MKVGLGDGHVAIQFKKIAAWDLMQHAPISNVQLKNREHDDIDLLVFIISHGRWIFQRMVL